MSFGKDGFPVPVPSGVLPILLNDAGRKLGRVLEGIELPNFLEPEKDGEYRINGVARGEDLDRLIPGASVRDSISVEVLIDRSTGHLTELVVVGPMLDGDPAGSVRRLELSNHNEPVLIRAPEAQ